MNLTTLDNRVLSIPVDQVMSPNTVKLVSGEGLSVDTSLPHTASREQREWAFSQQNKKGDLYILFDVEFPSHLSKEQKEQVAQILSN